MKTIAEIRRENLEILVAQFGTADVVAQRSGTAAVYLSQVRHRAVDSKTGKPRKMGNQLARKLEAGCGKEPNWMDYEHAPLSQRSERINHATSVMERMADWQLEQAIKIVDTLADTPPK